jgi:putative tryptophan/tyrosine transport system substrate-binding protein
MDMRRREFLGVLGGAATTWPVAARAQQTERVRRIGALLGISASDPEAPPRVAAFLSGLHDLGWDDGRNIKIELRFGGSEANSMRAYAKELVSLAPDVILAQSNLALATLLQETRTIPIIFTVIGDPVGSGFIKSLARPDGNATGFTSFEPSLAGKWVAFLKEIAPHLKRAAVILHQETKANVEFLRAVEAASASSGITITAAGVHDAAEIELSVASFARQSGDGGLIVFPNPITNGHRELIIKLAANHSLPAMYAFRYFATGGGLMSYGVNAVDLYKRAAVYVDRVLRGAKPADLPVQQPTKFELVLNLKTAKSLGLYVPPALLATADEVIE